MATLTITIPKWERFNPRADKANYTWFRFQNDFFHDQKIFELTPSQRCLYLFVLCECSKKNTHSVVLLKSYIGALLGISEKEINKDIHRLIEVGLVTSEGRPKDVQETSNVPATNVTNERNERDERNGITETEDLSAPALPRLVTLWNENCGSLSKVRGCTQSRKKAIQARLAEEPDLAYWAEVIQRLASSPFCRGENQRGWRASFDFLLQPDTHVKALEGKYDPPPDALGTQQADPVILREMEEIRKATAAKQAALEAQWAAEDSA